MILAISMAATALGQKLVPTAADVDQCAQLVNPSCNWQNGNLNENNSSYFEGDSVPYRMVFDGLTPGQQYTVEVEFDTTESGGEHTLDYLTTYNLTQAAANPCNGVTGCPAVTDTAPIPNDPILAIACPTCDQGGSNVFTFFGATFDDVDPYIQLPGGAPAVHYANASTNSVLITFTATNTTAVLAWGGHIASRLDWGFEETAVSLPGSPYHMRRGDGGGADRSLKVSSVTFPNIITVVKLVTVPGNPPTYSAAGVFFPFTVNPGTVSAGFSLEDSDPAQFSGGSNVIQSAVFDTDITITETQVNGWDLTNLACVVSGGGNSQVGTSSVDLNTRTATLNLREANIATCTFSNIDLSPTAAPASISGRVSDPFGYGLGYARVAVQNASTGEIKVATTNNFGYYTVSDLPSGEFYQVTVSHKRYSFQPQFLSLMEDVSGMDFMAVPQ